MLPLALVLAQASSLGVPGDTIAVQASQCAALYEFSGSGARTDKEQNLYALKYDLSLDIVMSAGLPPDQFKEIINAYSVRIKEAIKKLDEPSVHFLKEEMLRCDRLIKQQSDAKSESRAPEPTAPASSSYMHTSGGGFMMNFGTEIVGASYGVKFSLTKELPNGGLASAIFDNPENPSAPFEVSIEIPPNAKDFLVKSPKFSSAKNSTIYYVRVNLYSDKTRSNLLDTIQQGVLLSLPADLIPRAGITLKDG